MRRVLLISLACFSIVCAKTHMEIVKDLEQFAENTYERIMNYKLELTLKTFDAMVKCKTVNQNKVYTLQRLLEYAQNSSMAKYEIGIFLKLVEPILEDDKLKQREKLAQCTNGSYIELRNSTFKRVDEALQAFNDNALLQKQELATATEDVPKSIFNALEVYLSSANDAGFNNLKIFVQDLRIIQDNIILKEIIQFIQDLSQPKIKVFLNMREQCDIDYHTKVEKELCVRGYLRAGKFSSKTLREEVSNLDKNINDIQAKFHALSKVKQQEYSDVLPNIEKLLHGYYIGRDFFLSILNIQESRL